MGTPDSATPQHREDEQWENTPEGALAAALHGDCHPFRSALAHHEVVHHGFEAKRSLATLRADGWDVVPQDGRPTAEQQEQAKWRANERADRAEARIAKAAAIIELADHRASAADGPVGHARDEMSDAEWRELYVALTGPVR